MMGSQSTEAPKGRDRSSGTLEGFPTQADPTRALEAEKGTV